MDGCEEGMKHEFNLELIAIHNDVIRELTERTLKCAPSYFWTCPASGTGKYHKLDECVVSGTVLHTRRAVQVAIDLARFENLNELDTDIVISATILHDICKCGYPTGAERTVMGHGALVAQVMRDADVLDEPFARQIASLCAFHMSRWDCPFALPERDKLSRVVALADYVASRKTIMVKALGEGEY